MNGLALGVRGIVGKDARSRTRGWRPMLVLTVYLLLLTLAVVAMLGLTVNATGTVSPSLGPQLFGTLAGGSMVLVSFIAPALTAGSISGERERLTLDLLLVTRASSLGLVTGKLAGALLWVLYLMVASLPALGVVYLFGGVPLGTVLAALCVTLSAALAYSALGLLLSAVFGRTAVATVLTYALVLVTMVVLPIVAASLGITSALANLSAVPLAGRFQDQPPFGWPPAAAWLTFLSPGWAFVSVIAGQFGPAGGLASGAGLFSVYTYRAEASSVSLEAVTSLAGWVFNALVSLATAVIAVLLGALWLSPRRARPRRARGRHGS